jgi:hypothetical protein
MAAQALHDQSELLDTHNANYHFAERAHTKLSTLPTTEGLRE